MAKKSGVKVEQLYLSIGADLSELDADFVLADKTVKEAMDSLNRKNRKIKLQTEIDLSGLSAAEKATKGFEIQQKSLQEQLKISAQRVKITNVEYQNMVKELGDGAVASQRLEERLLREQKAYAALGSQIRKLNEDRKLEEAQQSRNGKQGNNKSSSNNGLIAGYLAGQGIELAGLYAGYQTIKTSAETIKESTQEAVNNGNEVYKLAEKYHMSAEEAEALNYQLKIVGVSAQDAIPAITRLDKQLLTAGLEGNNTTKALQKFGVSLETAPGALLPLNEQLKVLAEGYKKASDNGMEQEYVAQILGNKGLALLPILEEWAESEERLSHVKMTGALDYELAHKVTMEQKELNLQLEQLKLTAGAALMPVADEFLPDIIEAAGNLAVSIKDNKDAIKDVADGFINAGKTILDVLSWIADKADALGINLKKIADIMDRLTYMGGSHSGDLKQDTKNVETLGFGAALGGTIGALIPLPGTTVLGAAAGATIAGYLGSKLGDNKSGYQAYSDDKKEKADKDASDRKAKMDELEKQNALKKEAQIAEAARQRAEEVAKVNQELYDKLYKYTHTDLENNLHAVDEEVEAYRKKGASETVITQLQEESKAKIIEEFENTTMSKINDIWRDSLAQRMEGIEREKRAFIKAGVDEVNSARWAEEEKRQASLETARRALKEQRDMLNVMRAAMASGGTFEERVNKARIAMLLIQRQKLGLTADDITSPQEMALFSNISNQAQQNIIPGLERDQWAKDLLTSGTPVYRGTQMTRDYTNTLGDMVNVIRGTQQTFQSPNAGLSINLNINNPIVENEAHINKMADATLNKLSTAMQFTTLSQLLGNGG